MRGKHGRRGEKGVARAAVGHAGSGKIRVNNIAHEKTNVVVPVALQQHLVAPC
jgi:hypothetical protein